MVVFQRTFVIVVDGQGAVSADQVLICQAWMIEVMAGGCQVHAGFNDLLNNVQRLQAPWAGRQMIGEVQHTGRMDPARQHVNTCERCLIPGDGDTMAAVIDTPR